MGDLRLRIQRDENGGAEFDVVIHKPRLNAKRARSASNRRP